MVILIISAIAKIKIGVIKQAILNKNLIAAKKPLANKALFANIMTGMISGKIISNNIERPADGNNKILAPKTVKRLIRNETKIETQIILKIKWEEISSNKQVNGIIEIIGKQKIIQLLITLLKIIKNKLSLCIINCSKVPSLKSCWKIFSALSNITKSKQNQINEMLMISKDSLFSKLAIGKEKITIERKKKIIAFVI